ncbi:MAG: HlyD family secretion protein [Hyphomicrobiales bacterium]|nr:HlyD family secretion protein [Hyphomicrobiales bacterium]MDE2116148.1 HlyD family secretion protein [Hyphomicrobiales bacterium]
MADQLDAPVSAQAQTTQELTPVAETMPTQARSQQVATQEPGAPPATAPQDGQLMQPRRKKRNIILPVVIIAALGFGIVKGYDWFVVGRFIVATDDAYVKAGVTTLAAKIPGYITKVNVIDNQNVKKGDVIASIDPTDYQLAVEAAQKKMATQDATIARIDEQSQAQAAMINQAEAQLNAANGQLAGVQANLVRTSAAYDRAVALVHSHFGTQATLDQAKGDRDAAQAAVTSAQANIIGAQAAIRAAKANATVIVAQKTEAERARSEMQVALDQATHNLAFTQIVAPVDGIIGNKSVEVGNYVQPGQRLLALIPLDSVYVEANFKETQLDALKPGQKVSLTIDSLDGKKIEGVVQSIAPASGSQYSLLPPDNATGNFTKITQRVPVRIKVPAEVAASGELRPGLSVEADVNTRNENDPPPSLMGALGFTISKK